MTQQAVERLRNFHRLAKDVVERGVQYDEVGQRKEAEAHYRKAIELIRDSLAINVEETGNDQTDRQVKLLEKELLSWHTSCVDRVRSLEPSRRRKQQTLTRKGTDHASMAKRGSASAGAAGGAKGSSKSSKSKKAEDELRSMIESEIVDSSPGVAWSDVTGLDKAKQLIQEMVILPATRPDLFKGLRAPTRGLLLYGPPGNGKTLLAKAAATESRCTFFAISASTLTSKWVGEAEKLVRKLFEVASERQPAIIFIDEIDSVLSARSANENEASRRLKTEFLIQFDGVSNAKTGGQVFVIGATNRPEELDDAVRRRLAKRIQIPLPDSAGRYSILTNLLKDQKVKMTRREFEGLVDQTSGYSASDMKELCHEAAMMAIRELSAAKLATVKEGAVRPIISKDFSKALQTIKSSVSADQLARYDLFTKDFGTA